MKVFVSYSIGDDQYHLVSRLTNKLSRAGYLVYKTNPYTTYPRLDRMTHNDLFIGLVTSVGQTDEYFNEEFQFAIEHNIPRISLIQEGVNFDVIEGENIVWFNRDNMDQAINHVIQMRNAAVHGPATVKPSNSWAWVLGAAAVVTILGLLSNKK